MFCESSFDAQLVPLQAPKRVLNTDSTTRAVWLLSDSGLAAVGEADEVEVERSFSVDLSFVRTVSSLDFSCEATSISCTIRNDDD